MARSGSGTSEPPADRHAAARPENINAVAFFAPDGAHVFAIFRNGRGYRWDVRERAWERKACSIAGRRLTPAEWHQALPAVPTRPRAERRPRSVPGRAPPSANAASSNIDPGSKAVHTAYRLRVAPGVSRSVSGPAPVQRPGDSPRPSRSHRAPANLTLVIARLLTVNLPIDNTASAPPRLRRCGRRRAHRRH